MGLVELAVTIREAIDPTISGKMSFVLAQFLNGKIDGTIGIENGTTVASFITFSDGETLYESARLATQKQEDTTGSITIDEIRHDTNTHTFFHRSYLTPFPLDGKFIESRHIGGRILPNDIWHREIPSF